jgi:hypothetical protein
VIASVCLGTDWYLSSVLTFIFWSGTFPHWWRISQKKLSNPSLELLLMMMVATMTTKMVTKLKKKSQSSARHDDKRSLAHIGT